MVGQRSRRNSSLESDSRLGGSRPTTGRLSGCLAITCGKLKVSDRPSRLFSAQQETVQRSPGWDWIFTFVVAEMRASGCSVLLS